MSEQQDTTEITEGYTAGQAAVVLARNSGRDVNDSEELDRLADLVKKLAQMKIIRKVRVSSRLNLYNKEDVDKYTVEERGAKSARAAQTRAKKRNRTSQKSSQQAI